MTELPDYDRANEPAQAMHQSGRPAPDPKPVVALDVDGVIRVLRAPDLDNIGRYVTPKNADPAVLTVREGDDLFTPFHAMRAGTFRIHLVRGVGDWIRSLLERGIDVVWATTWMDHANTYIAPLIGIPALPVAVALDENSFRFRGDSAAWKLDQLARKFRGRPLAWIDDNPPEVSGEFALERARARRRDGGVSLAIVPNPYVGLTVEVMAEVDAWLNLVSTAEGRAQVRADRQRDLRRIRDARRRSQQQADDF